MNQIHPEPLSGTLVDILEETAAGERDRLRLLRGHSPQGISKGKPLRYAFADFSRKRKVSASVGGMSPQKRRFAETYL